MSAVSEADVKIVLPGMPMPAAYRLRNINKVKHETGFKTFLNALDYSAVFYTRPLARVPH
jgi:hypothetical protein